MIGLRGRSRWVMVAVIGLVTAVGLAACGGSDSDGESGAGMAADEMSTDGFREQESSDLSAPESAGGSSDDSGASSGVGGLGSLQVDLGADDSVFGSPQIIKNGQVELRVDRGSFNEAINEVIRLAQRYGGNVQSTAIEDSGDGRGTVIVRVPSASFEDAIEDLSEIGRLESQFVDTQDVTEEFVDLQSRIRNARSAERVLLDLMGEASSIADTIRVQNQLERVQENIERMRGRLRVLKDQTSFSTVAVDLVEAGAKEEDPEKAGALSKAWHDAIDGFMGVISAVIVASGVVLPIAVMALVVALLVRRMRPRFERAPEPEAQA